ncbi:MAG: 2-amino-4-hydroxy-6-hydroxymethyldihydropteridine diphosphokinase [Bacteroidales bacterium]|nr:2-amino-4-hydroxy-6-hydroxymethyldihydropteridine diphosphokinase [Bacteroidales bacterium]
MTVYANIGSNQGDRHALIEQAVALIAKSFPDGRIRNSDYIESEPWGYDSPNAFLNLGIAIDLDVAEGIGPELVLDRLLTVERCVSDSPHRNADGSYRDRPIDIDLIAIDFLEVNTPNLILPHPRAHLRDFVMIPLRQLAPESLIDWLLNVST